jgi:two-component system cell cycle response regulator
VLKEGRVVLNAGSSVINCVIRDRSDSGARLRLPAATELPGTFGVLFLTEEILYPARIVWRHKDDLGIEFVGQPKSVPLRKW